LVLEDAERGASAGEIACSRRCGPGRLDGCGTETLDHAACVGSAFGGKRPVSRGCVSASSGSVLRVPRLADAFAALLAAEQASPPIAAAPVWPSTASAPVSREVVEEAARRILQEMTQNAVRDIVSEIAERLVREEIERIRKSIT
jgi:hypothetical protein